MDMLLRLIYPLSWSVGTVKASLKSMLLRKYSEMKMQWATEMSTLYRSVEIRTRTGTSRNRGFFPFRAQYMSPPNMPMIQPIILIDRMVTIVLLLSSFRKPNMAAIKVKMIMIKPSRSVAIVPYTRSLTVAVYVLSEKHSSRTSTRQLDEFSEFSIPFRNPLTWFAWSPNSP